MQTQGTDQAAGVADSTARNHPLALRMAIIAFLNQNITIATLFGTFSVLFAAVEAHLGVGPKLASMGIPAVNLATAVCAPLAGVIAIRYSLRAVMLIGSILGVLGFVMLAISSSYALYLIAYGFFIGPAMASVGVVLPATLVTRWFVVNRGRALGLITIPLVIACMPLSSTWMLQSHGLIATYWALAALSAVCVIANIFVVNHPPGALQPAPGADATAAAPATASATVGQLLSSSRFWGMALASIAVITCSVILTANMVLIAGSWGFSPAQGATLLSMQTLGGLAGTVTFGWIADKLGGARAMALLVIDAAIMIAALLFHPPFVVTAAIIAIFGLHSSGSLPVTGTALSEIFGRESFSRAYGIFNLVNLPFSVACVPAAAAVFERTGSYSQALLWQAIFLAVSSPLALFAHRAGVERMGRSVLTPKK